MPRTTAALLPALLLVAALLAPPARGQPGTPNVVPEPGAAGPAFIDSAGRRVTLPAVIRRVLPAGRNAQVLVEVLAPDKLAGRDAAGELSIGWNAAGMAAAARRTGADLILDASPITLARVAFANEVQRLSGVPYVLVDDSFDRMPRMLRAIGAILGVEDRAQDLGTYADHAISDLRGLLLITPADSRPHVYFALGPDGLTTALPGSPADAALEEAGVINVASPLGRDTIAPVSTEQLLAWDPGVIIAEDRSAYDWLRRAPSLRGVAAVQHQRVYLEPTAPYGWIEDPSGINRLIGLHWLSTLFYPTATQEDLRTDVCDFYDRFYRIKLTNAQLEAMVRAGGVPPVESGRNLPEPLIGLGAAPPTSLGEIAPVLPAAPGPTSTPTPTRGAAASPSELTGVPGLPNTAPSAACTVPTAPSPLPLPGLAPVPGMQAAPNP
ncbi:MAG TPA: ABC transporter substrate-binding protein [Stellaceae bacterium]|nr:ABC transporter substrate-binding protein [Stellaceae bacterium]